MRSPRSLEVDEFEYKLKHRKVPKAKAAMTCDCSSKGLPQGSCHSHKKSSKKFIPVKKSKGKVPEHLKKFLFKKK